MTLTVFLDRDGTINRKASEGAYIRRPSEVELLPGAAEAIRTLKSAGCRILVVTNQRGISLGKMTESDLEIVWQHTVKLLAQSDAHVDGMYFCPHDVCSCDCRKPLPGLLLRAAREIPGVKLQDAVMIGDAHSDVLAGKAAGTRTIRIARQKDDLADHTATDLSSAVLWLLNQNSHRERN